MLTLMEYLREEHHKLVEQLLMQASALHRYEQDAQRGQLSDQVDRLMTADGFTRWAETFLALHSPTEISHTYDGIAVRLGNGTHVQMARVVPASVATV
jgi:hypothetical protein